MGEFSGALRRRESQCKYRILLRFRVVTMSRMGNETGGEAKGQELSTQRGKQTLRGKTAMEEAT